MTHVNRILSEVRLDVLGPVCLHTYLSCDTCWDREKNRRSKFEEYPYPDERRSLVSGSHEFRTDPAPFKLVSSRTSYLRKRNLPTSKTICLWLKFNEKSTRKWCLDLRVRSHVIIHLSLPAVNLVIRLQYVSDNDNFVKRLFKFRENYVKTPSSIFLFYISFVDIIVNSHLNVRRIVLNVAFPWWLLEWRFSP